MLKLKNLLRLFINMVKWKLVNAAFSLKFNITFDLDYLANNLKSDRYMQIKYISGYFPKLIIKFESANKRSKYSIILFKTGLVTITGIKRDVNRVFDLIERLKDILREYNINLSDPNSIELMTTTVSGEFDYKNINIAKIYGNISEAKLSSGRLLSVIVPYYYSQYLKVTFRVFKNGKFICIGIKGDLNNINQLIDDVIKSFQKHVIREYAK